MREWGLLLKIRVASGPAPDRAQLDRILARLPGPDRRLTGGGADFTVSWWERGPDAASAVRSGADALRRYAAAEGIGHLVVIRAHAASVEGRSPAFAETAAHLDAADTWAVDLKAAAPVGGAKVGADMLPRVRDALGRDGAVVTFRNDQEKFLLDDGSGVTIRCWANGRTPRDAFGAVRGDVRRALEAVGLRDWRIVRFKARTPRNVHDDTFVGAASRAPEPTEEMR